MKTLDELEKEVFSEPFSGREFEQLTIDKVKKDIFKRTIKALSEIGIDGARYASATNFEHGSNYLFYKETRSKEGWDSLAKDQDRVILVEHAPVAAQILQLKQENDSHKELNRKLANHNADYKDKIDQLEAENKRLKEQNLLLENVVNADTKLMADNNSTISRISKRNEFLEKVISRLESVKSDVRKSSDVIFELIDAALSGKVEG